MGALTDDMTRLCGEIRSMRKARFAMKSELARATKDRKAAVRKMQAGFANAHGEMARKTKAGREAFASNLKRAVARKRREFRDDLAGAQRAWSGAASARIRPVEPVKRQFAEPEAKAGQKERAMAQPAGLSKPQGKRKA